MEENKIEDYQEDGAYHFPLGEEREKPITLYDALGEYYGSWGTITR
jgi:hypothetical protein